MTNFSLADVLDNDSFSHQTKSLRNVVPLYLPKQVYQIEKSWFDDGNHSYGLMQQAAWQMARWMDDKCAASLCNVGDTAVPANATNGIAEHMRCAYVFVGSGNNGGDGWLVASYLKQLGWQVSVVEVGTVATHDAKLAKQQAQENKLTVIDFEQLSKMAVQQRNICFSDADLVIDALFGIGLDRAPQDNYAKAIEYINHSKGHALIKGHALVVAIDVPSGLNSRTGEIYDTCAIKADITLCLVARKFGLHTKDGSDVTGKVIDIPLIPSVLNHQPIAHLKYAPLPMPKRQNNTHKGSFGHVLIIGGNQVNNSQGMGGAALLSASGAFAAGAGKVTVACHANFHSSVIANVANAMSIDLYDTVGVKALIEQCDVVAIGMGLGRDQQSQTLFDAYLETCMQAGVSLIIDADGLYHLATLNQRNVGLKQQLAEYTQTKGKHQGRQDSKATDNSTPQIFYTPHSGEAAKLLGVEVATVESDRLKAVHTLANDYHGSWLLKGSGSIVSEPGHSDKSSIYICAAGNAGMATAGMGDVLSGLAAGLLAQTDLPDSCRSLQQAVMIHAVAGDRLAARVGQRMLQATDMTPEIGAVIKQLEVSSANN